MSTVFWFLAVWFGLNLAFPGFIYWQRSPHLRHRVYHLTIGAFRLRREHELAHALVHSRR